MKKNTFYSLVVVSTLASALTSAGCQSNAESAASLGGDDNVSPDPAEKPGWASSLFGAKEEPVPPAVLPAGQKLAIRTTSTFSTKSTASGETFVAHLQEPLVDGNRTIAPTGAQVVGRVTHSDKGGRVKGVAKIAIELIEFEAANGQRIPIQTSAYQVNAKKTHTKDAQKVGIGAGIGAAIGAIADGGKGVLKGAGIGGGAGAGAVLATRGDDPC